MGCCCCVCTKPFEDILNDVTISLKTEVGYIAILRGTTQSSPSALAYQELCTFKMGLFIRVLPVEEIYVVNTALRGMIWLK